VSRSGDSISSAVPTFLLRFLATYIIVQKAGDIPADCSFARKKKKKIPRLCLLLTRLDSTRLDFTAMTRAGVCF